MERTGAYQADHTADFVHRMATLYNMKVSGGSCVVYGGHDEGIGGKSGTTVGGSLRAMFSEGGWDIDEMTAPPDDDYGADVAQGGCCDLAHGCGVSNPDPEQDYAYNLPEDASDAEADYNFVL